MRARIRIPTSSPLRRKMATLKCLACGKYGVQLAHIRWNHEGGWGLKPDDTLMLPLCPDCHEAQENGGAEWLAENIVKKLARDIWTWPVEQDEDNIVFWFIEYRAAMEK